jgi:hypothetical protein
MKHEKFVYVISSPLGYQKIGWSKAPDDRLEILSIAHPEPLELYCTWLCDKATQVELTAHAMLAAHRANGEWFKVDPDHAACTVMLAISEVLARKPWQRQPRIALPVARHQGVRWTSERKDRLRVLWKAGVSSRHVMDDLHTLPGRPLDMSGITTQARKMELARPEGYVNTHDSARWTKERVALLMIDYPIGVVSQILLEKLNNLDGDPITLKHMAARVAATGLRRPDGFTSIKAADARSRNPRWPPEREALLRKAWPEGMLPRPLLAALSALPGTDDLIWERVRERAKHLNLHRPPGFTENFAHLINAQAIAERDAETVARLRSPRWSPERDAVIREMWPKGVFTVNLMRILTPLPGTPILTPGSIRERANDLGLRRDRQ